MAYGVQVYGDSGRVQLDDTNRSPQLIASGTITNVVYEDITIPSQASTVQFPLVFVRPSADSTYVGGMRLVNNTTLRIMTDRTSKPAGGSLTTKSVSVDYAIFGLQSPAIMDGSGGFGLQIYNASGERVFDSRYEPARIQTCVNIDQPGASTPNTPSDQTYPQTYGFTGWGIRPWICLNPFMLEFNDDAEWSMFVSNSGTNNIRIRLAEVLSDGVGPLNITWLDAQSSGGTIWRGFSGYRADVPLIRRRTD